MTTSLTEPNVPTVPTVPVIVAENGFAEGHLADVCADLGVAVRVHDMYGPVGSIVYDDISRRDPHEIREIIAATRRIPGPVLDLAAGSGRLTAPLLAAGRSVTALELSPTMLDLLRDRVATLPPAARGRCSIVAADMRDFSLSTRFGVIVLGTTSISLLDRNGRARLFERVQEHLAPGGRFLISTLQIAPGAETDARTEVTGASGRTYRLHERVDPAAGIRSVVIRSTTPDGEQQVCASAVRIVRPEVLDAELQLCGLRVQHTRPLPTGSDRYRDALLTVRRTDDGSDR